MGKLEKTAARQVATQVDIDRSVQAPSFSKRALRAANWLVLLSGLQKMGTPRDEIAKRKLEFFK